MHRLSKTTHIVNRRPGMVMKALAFIYAVVGMRRVSAYELILEKYSSLRSAFFVGINLLLYRLQSTHSYKVTAICIEPTNICNLRCTRCIREWGISRKNGFMSVDLVQKLVRENPSVETFTVAYLGEPTLHKNLIEIFRIIKKSGKRVDTHTNGYRLSDKVLKDIFSSGVDTLNFSLDACGAEFTALRGFPYEHLEDCIMRAVGLKTTHGFSTKIKIQTVVNEQTFAQMDQIKNRWEGVVDSIKFVPYRYLSPAPGTKRGCLEAWRGAVIVLWDGRVIPCCYDYNGEMTLGNAAHQGLNEIWNGEPARRLRSSLLRGNLYALCRRCAEWPRGFRT